MVNKLHPVELMEPPSPDLDTIVAPLPLIPIETVIPLPTAPIDIPHYNSPTPSTSLEPSSPYTPVQMPLFSPSITPSSPSTLSSISSSTSEASSVSTLIDDVFEPAYPALLGSRAPSRGGS